MSLFTEQEIMNLISGDDDNDGARGPVIVLRNVTFAILNLPN